MKLIIAFDFTDYNSAFALLKHLDPSKVIIKIGSVMFTRFGPIIIKEIKAQGFKIFLDLKYHDIPNTVAEACRAAAELGVWMVNVHAQGGVKMMQAAAKALEDFGAKRPLLIAVTVLTSLTELELKEITPSFRADPNLPNTVLKLATLAKEANLDGVVCSVMEASTIKDTLGENFLTITPGIRLDRNKHDQSRVGQIDDLLRSDYIVVGRAITLAENPLSIIDKFLQA